ncbi:MAG: FkbM family methyltransferase [Verrucomicrobia bacterium]|nr:FkbM family methyltransferase [Verrucomicrobiota bacterium]
MSRLEVAVFKCAQQYLRLFSHHRGQRFVISLARRILGNTWIAAIGTGLRMYADPADAVEGLILQDRYEPHTTELFVNLLEPGSTVVDIGAHTGYYTMLAAERVGPRGQVHSFEPVSFLFERLSRNVDLNSLHNVCLNNVALWDKETELALYLPTNRNSGGTSIVRTPKTQQEPIFVNSLVLDSYVNGNGVGRIDLIKIDAEGAELFILKGGTETLKESMPDVICEIHEHTFPAAGYSPEDLLHFMGGLGYQAFYIETPWSGVHYAYFSQTPRASLPLWEWPITKVSSGI